MSFDQPFTSSGHWFKGNLHTHTSESDARWSVAECVAFYRERGYDFLAITDHWLLTDANAHAAGRPLLISGTELNGWTTDAVQHHVLGLGIRGIPGRDAAATLSSTVAAIHERGGLAVVAHPEWSKQTAEHIAGDAGTRLLEVFNATCEVRKGNGVSTSQWDALLNRGERWFALATDDTHLLPGFDDRGKGWIHVRAVELSIAAILDAVARGHFWSTSGPTLHDLRIDAGVLTASCSPCRAIVVIADGARVATTNDPDAAVTEIVTPLPASWSWVRVECHDAAGGIAWSNPLFRSASTA